MLKRDPRGRGGPHRLFACLLVLLFFAPSASAEQQGQDLTALSIEDLMNITITSVSKREQQLFLAATAVFVITQEDIRRSGATTIPDLLRMVPGVDVAQINANNWAVSARGFNSQFADKLLVLIDGRAVYTPLLAGVNWDTSEVPLEDIERIEVIRGPGATIWGANAVNGVINVITKTTSETLGGLVTAGGGLQPRALAMVRYGGKIGIDTGYRVFTEYQDSSHFSDPSGQDAQDGWHLAHSGFRVDNRTSAKDSVTLQGDLYTGREGASIIHIFSVSPPEVGPAFTSTNLLGGNLLGRWNHAQSSRSDSMLQVYFDKFSRSGPEASEARDTLDLEFNHHLVVRTRQDWVLGAGYRRSSDHTTGTVDQAFVPANRALHLLTTFAQDQITLKPDRLFLTVGAKLEHNDFDSFEVQPSARIAWTAFAPVEIWAAVSRASRNPSRKDSDLVAALDTFPGPTGTSPPIEVVLFGNPQIVSQHVVAYEAGGRAHAGAHLSVDVATFFNKYDHLITVEPGAPLLESASGADRVVVPLTFGNLMHGTTFGVEATAKWAVTADWELSPGYALTTMRLQTDVESQDTNSVSSREGSSPQHQAQLRSHVELWHGLSWDAAGYFVGRLPFQDVPAHTRVDTQVRWQLRKGLTVMVVGQNLLESQHLELLDFLTLVNASLIKRSVYAKVVLSF